MTKPNPFILDPKKHSPNPDKSPHDYQKKAWEELNQLLGTAKTDNDNFRALLVMPTGSGKTYTAVRWLIREHLNKNGRVFWIAHRHDLLEQAKQEFEDNIIDSVRKLKFRTVSGNASSVKAIEETDDVVFCSILSLHKGNEPWLNKKLQDENIMLVIDEAHHAVARNYRRVINILQSSNHFKLLGLTATPTRTINKEQPQLAKLFQNNDIRPIKMSELIDKRYLARPIPVSVKTNCDAEKSFTEHDDYNMFINKNILSERFYSHLAKLKSRNRLIVDHYVSNKDDYKKTIIFAINISQAKTLAADFEKSGINAAYVASSHHDFKETNSDRIERFKNPKSKLRVLVSVDILTEGIDIPCAQTVFLARPTRSEIKLRQMIGRVLRGPKTTNGTEIAYIVSFEDQWEHFKDWESPLNLVPEILSEGEEERATKLPRALLERLDLKVLQECYDKIALAINRDGEDSIEVFQAVPAGWYILNDTGRTTFVTTVSAGKPITPEIEPEDDDYDYKQIFVYEHQRKAWNKLVSDLWKGKAIGDCEQLSDVYFDPSTGPQPSLHFVQLMIDHYKHRNAKPTLIEYGERNSMDPTKLAKEIVNSTYDSKSKYQYLLGIYNKQELARAIYRKFEDYYAVVCKEEMKYLKSSNDQVSNVPAPKRDTKYEVPDKQYYHIDNHYESRLPILFDQMISLANTILPRKCKHKISVKWSSKLRNYWGLAYYDKNLIKINSILNSSVISEKLLVYLLYHEYLHIYLKSGNHKTDFTNLESKWPDFDKLDIELDTLHERFDLEEMSY